MTLCWSYFFSHSIRESETSLFKKHPFKKQLTKIIFARRAFLPTTYQNFVFHISYCLFILWRQTIFVTLASRGDARNVTFVAKCRDTKLSTNFHFHCCNGNEPKRSNFNRNSFFFSTRSERNQLMMNFSFGWFWQQSDVCEEKKSSTSSSSSLTSDSTV